MIYIDYDWFCENYAEIPESEFNRLALRASLYLDKVTFDRIAEAVETDENIREVARFVCAEMMMAIDSSDSAEVDGKTVKSISNDGYSVSFVTEADGGASLLDVKLYDIATDYLPTWLLSMETCTHETGCFY